MMKIGRRGYVEDINWYQWFKPLKIQYPWWIRWIPIRSIRRSLERWYLNNATY